MNDPLEIHQRDLERERLAKEEAQAMSQGPGLSNEEFIDFNQKFLEKASTKGLRNMLNVDMVLAQTLKEALDRLEALVKANEDNIK